MLTIGICGASGSGKSTLARELARCINQPSVLLRQDTYYLDHPELSFEERRALNFDEPASFDHDALYQDLLPYRRANPSEKKTTILRCTAGVTPTPGCSQPKSPS